jgi:ADP-ribose pyrophosphatase YjhB (NUDIX family)
MVLGPMTALRTLADIAVRPLASLAGSVRFAVRGDGPKGSGAHAVALTPDGRIILVRLRYAPGWRLPGGGRAEGESLADVALRELTEEIGMTGHGDVRPLTAIDPSLVLVEDVAFKPHRWSWEVERVIAADPAQLPADLAPVARRWLAAFLKAR